jgi:CRP/FNR family cyclic AMP-dependent transcriptional regulator
MRQDPSAAVDELIATAPQAELPGGAVRSLSSLPGTRVLVVEEGFVVLRATDPASGRGVVVCHGGPATILPFILPSHDLVALVDSRLTVITVELYERLLELPEAAQALLRGVEANVRQQQRTIVALASSHHLDRLREKLLQLAEDHGRVARDGVLLQLPITHELLAEMIGSARETVTRAVDALEQSGFLRRQDRGYVLRVSPGALER